ncbi:MAG: hypothetical protein IJJ69_03655 [Oscillospiraceae bacterium]|nr:hypothetical protein [Oscillospiraceae bacterium]
MLENLLIYGFIAGCAALFGKALHDDPEGTMKRIAEKVQDCKEKQESGKAGDNNDFKS